MKKLLLTFLIAFITALGANAAVESTYKHTFEKQQLTTNAGSNTLSGVSWSWDAMNDLSFDTSNYKRGVQIGSKSSPQTSDWSIYTTGISGTITSVKVNACTGGSATLKVSVGGTAFACGKNTTQNLTSTASYYEFTGSASGEIKITMRAGSKAMYLKSISVTFTSGGGSSETKELGAIKMGSTEISTVETNPTTATVKGDAKIEFTSENAASISVYTLPYTEGDTPAASEGSPSVTWKAPAAKESEQTVRLKVVSKLGTDIKEAYVTVTVQKKADVSDNFVLITDANDLSTEYTYILYGCNDSRGKQALMKSSVSSGYFAANQNQSTFNISDDFSSIQIDEANTETAIITLEESTNSGKYYLKIGNKYISVSGTDASLSTTKTEFTITFDTKNRAELKVGSNYLGYNASTPRFKPYNGDANRLGSIYLYAKKTMTPVEPGEVTSDPAADQGVITINKNEEITFSSKDAAKLQVSTQSEPVVGSSYKYKPTEEGKVTITPIDSEGKVYTEKAATFTIKFFKGLVDGLIEYPVSEFVYTIGSEATLPELVKEPADVDVEYSISHERVENGMAVYNPATIDEQGNITVNTPGIVTVTATVKADRNKTASYVLEIQSLKEAEIAGTGSATPTGNVYTKVVDDNDPDLYENGHLYAILSYHDGKVYAMTPEVAGANEGLKAVVIKEGVTGFEDTYTIDNSKVANMLLDLENTLCLTYNDNGTLKYLVSPSVRHMQLTAETPTVPHSFAYSTNNDPYRASLKIDDCPIYCNPDKLYFNTFDALNSQLGTFLFNCFLYKVGTAMSSASTVKAPVVHITGGNVYYSPDGEWYWGTEDESHKLSFANETDSAKIYYTMTSATPSSANVRAMANSATGTEYRNPFTKSVLDGKKITFWAVKDGQKSAVETLNFNIKTGIEDIDVENGEAIEEEGDARYFNLQGLEVKNPGEGIYIRVANGKATKILKK